MYLNEIMFTRECSHVTAKVQGGCEADVFTHSNLHDCITTQDSNQFSYASGINTLVYVRVFQRHLILFMIDNHLVFLPSDVPRNK